jgi:hypothetical protein
MRNAEAISGFTLSVSVTLGNVFHPYTRLQYFPCERRCPKQKDDGKSLVVEGNGAESSNNSY